MLEINYTLNLMQLLKIAPKLKRYLWQKMKPNKPNKPYNVAKIVPFEVLEVATTIIIMIIIWQLFKYRLRKNIVKDVLLNGGSRININIQQLKLRFGLPMLKPAPYNLKMVNQTTTKPVGLICDLKIYVHSIPRYYYVYCVTKYYNRC